MGRTILKYIYSWSVVHTFNIRWISTLDMTLVRSYHIYTPPLPLPQIKQLFRLKGFKRIMCNYLNKVLKYLKKGHCTVVYYYTLFTFKNRNTNNLKDIEYYEIQI